MVTFLTCLFLLLHLFKSSLFMLSTVSFLSTSLLFLFLSSDLLPVLSASLYQIKHLWTLASTRQPALYKAWPSPEVCPSHLLTNPNVHFHAANLFIIMIVIFLIKLPALILVCLVSTALPCVPNITALFICV